jgi:KDO2-lipid IV(A) lauroyltransferase
MSEVMGALPPALAEKIARGLGVASYYAMRNKRRITRENFARVLQLPPRHPQVGSVARASFVNYTVYLLHLLRYESVTADELNQRVQFHVSPEIEAVLQNREHPLIMVSIHFGNMDYAGPATIKRYRPLTIAAETIKPEDLFEYLARLRSQHGMHLIPYDRAPRKIIEALKRKEIVGFMLDIGIDGFTEIHRAPVTFFGEPTLFPSNPLILAQRYHAPLFCIFAHNGKDKEIHVHLDGPFYLSPDLARPQAEHNVMRQIAASFERMIQAYPDQWYIYRRVWQPLTRAADSTASPLK